MRFDYIHHILVDLYGTQITIERDEENNYRALVAPELMQHGKVDTNLVQALVAVLESL
jgi:hypothetical protein